MKSAGPAKWILISCLSLIVLIAGSLSLFAFYLSTQQARLSREVGQRDALAHELQAIGSAIVDGGVTSPAFWRTRLPHYFSQGALKNLCR